MSWKIERHYHAIYVTHCDRQIGYDPYYHDWNEMLTCKTCGKVCPKDQVTPIIKLTQVLRKYEL